jgi:hypothetical protein
MADAIALSQNPPISLSTRFLRLLPGVALLAAIGFAGKLLEKNINMYPKPTISRSPTSNTSFGPFSSAWSSPTSLGSPKFLSQALPPTNSGSRPVSFFSARAFFSVMSPNLAASVSFSLPSKSPAHSRS